MDKVGNGIVLVILGLLVICFPLLGIVPLAVLAGFSLFGLGLGLLTTGFTSLKENALKGFVEAVLGVFALIVGLGFVFNPLFFSFAAAIFVFISGMLLILTGITGLVTNTDNDASSSIVALIIGILYMFIATFVANPYYLGWLIGIWMLITGVLCLISKD